MQYYVLQTRSGKESLILRMVAREHPGLAEFFHWPRRILREKKAGKIREREKSLYPGYLFFRTEEDSPSAFMKSGEFHLLVRMRGLSRFLPDNAHPLPLPEEEARLLRTVLRKGDLLPVSEVSFDENQRIVVKSGPLKGLEGAIVKVDRRKQRARVRMDLYEESHLIDFSFNIISGEPS